VSELIPLFPLDLVLLPGAPLPLHVFEPRYKEMISECLTEKSRFGVVRAKEDEVAEIGCSAEIVSVTKKYPDGRMDILTEGRRPFEVMHLNRDRAFLRAEVLFLHDQSSRPTTDEIAAARKLHQEVAALAGIHEDATDATDESQLSFNLAGSLPLDLDFKQTLLGIRSEAERLRALISFFETVLPGLRRAAQVRRTSGGNGHVH
jgi:Lon protease-like protein